MLKIFTIKFEDKHESFNESILTGFLDGKEIIRWDAHLITRKNDHYWTVLVEYESAPTDLRMVQKGVGTPNRNERYKDIMTDKDWPLFKILREWRGERSRKEGVPPYIIFTNLQLARIAVTRPVSLNALQEIDGIGKAKREKYGKAVLKIIASFENPERSVRGNEESVLEHQSGGQGKEVLKEEEKSEQRRAEVQKEPREQEQRNQMELEGRKQDADMVTGGPNDG